MKKFVAKLKNNEHIIIFDTPEDIAKLDFYNIPNIHIEKEFNPDISLEQDEWFFVLLNETKKNEMIKEYFECVDNSVELNKITKDNYQNIESCYLIDDNKIIFTKITKGYLVRDTKFLYFSNLWAEVHEQKDSISFSWIVDAYYDWVDKIYFKNYSKVKSLFKWFEDYYKQATNEQKDEFLNNDFFISDKDISDIKVWDRNLRKIAYLIEEKKIDLSDKKLRDKYLDYAKEYWELDIRITTDWKLEFDTNKDITNILNLLEEHFYTTPITWEKREINSSKKIWNNS